MEARRRCQHWQQWPPNGNPWRLDGATPSPLLRYGLSKRLPFRLSQETCYSHQSVSWALLACPSPKSEPMRDKQLFVRSFGRRVDGASDYQCAIPAEKEQEAQPKQWLCLLYRTVAPLYSKLSVTCWSRHDHSSCLLGWDHWHTFPKWPAAYGGQSRERFDGRGRPERLSLLLVILVNNL